LTASQRHRLKTTAHGHKSPHRDRLRAQIVLDAAGDHTNAAIARRRRVSVDTVRKWRGRFAAEGIHGLGDRKRSGRPPRFTALQQTQVKALACELPANSGVPLSRWSSAELADEAITAGVVESISACTVRRWLRRDALKPCGSGPGSRHARPTSPNGPPWCSTYTPAPSTANRSARTTTCCARTRNPQSQPAAAATPPCHPAGPD
jgi:transposase